MKNNSIKIIISLIVILLVVSLTFLFKKQEVSDVLVTNFQECHEAGNPIMESYPRQCNSKDGGHFVEEIGNEIEKMNLIRLESPRPNEVIKNPLIVKGEARGYWFFEASFPVMLTNWDGLIIAEGIAQAKSEWMTEDSVPFEATLNFVKPDYGKRGTLILKKDNPSGLPEYDDALEIPISFE